MERGLLIPTAAALSNKIYQSEYLQMSSNTSKGKAIFRVVSGNFLEMFDFMVYGFYATAIAKFSRILKMPQTDRSADALEMLGLARQKNGQTAEARAAYAVEGGRAAAP